MLQHGICGLRATVTEPVIELVDTLHVRTVFALENQAAPLASRDRVHDTELNSRLPSSP